MDEHRYGCPRCGRDFAAPGACPACGAEALLDLQQSADLRAFEGGRGRSRSITWAALLLVILLFLGFEFGLDQLPKLGVDLGSQPMLVGGITLAVLAVSFHLIRRQR